MLSVGGGAVFARWRSFMANSRYPSWQRKWRSPGPVKSGLLSPCAAILFSLRPVASGWKSLLPKLDFMVSIDNYINETTRHADVILPTPSGLEVDHYDLVFNMFAINNNAKFSEAMVKIEDDRPFDWQILKELIKRLNERLSLFERFATPRRVVNWGLMLGRYGCLSHPKRWFGGLSLKKVIASRHGIDLGPLLPRIPECLMTTDGKVHIAPEVFTSRLKNLPNEDEGDGGFRLIGRRNLRTNNSWMHQFAKLSQSSHVKCTAMINEGDARQLSIAEGDLIKVSSKVGSIVLPAEITDTIMPGVVSIPHGFGHTRKDTRIPNAEAKPGVSVNDITDPKCVDPLTGNAAFSGQPVMLARHDAEG